jgi:hypothetical protein
VSGTREHAINLVHTIDGALRRRYFRCVKLILKTEGQSKMRTVRFVCWLALLAGALLYQLDRANAQTSPEVEQACTSDAMRLCSDVIPDVPKVTACMTAKYSQLSEPCRVAMANSKRAAGKHAEHHYRYRHCRHHCG